MGVMLRHTGRCMPQHFRYVFEFDVIGQGDGCGKCVSGYVHCQMLFDATKISYFLDVGIHFLVGKHRKYLS